MRLILTLALFLSVAASSYSVGALLTLEHAIWKWPASGQVAWVFSVVIFTAVMYGLLGINRPDDEMEQFDDRR